VSGKRTRLRANWSNIAALAVTTASVALLTWGWLDLAAQQVCS